MSKQADSPPSTLPEQLQQIRPRWPRLLRLIRRRRCAIAGGFCAAVVGAILLATLAVALGPSSAKAQATSKPASSAASGAKSAPPIGKSTGKEPASGRLYYMYVPMTYDPSRQYPLIVTAHGSFPFDSGAGQRDSWVKVAEENDLIVCSPDFDGASGLLGIPKDKPAPALLRDEKAILAIVKTVRSQYNINKDGIMITGWSGGGLPAQFIGLRHPEIFRAIVGRTANFNEYLVDDETARRARHLHVYVFFGVSDIAGIAGQNRLANFWYTIRGFANFKIRQVAGGHAKNNRRTAEWFLNLLKTYPVARIKASPKSGKAPLTVRFRVAASDPDGRIQTSIFRFDDGEVSIRPDVLHTFRRPGLYNVMLTVIDNDGHREYAQVDINVTE
ncbi:MAG: PKD domain-containing protein [Phycisphaerae bacterium]|nr:PKD domain-containing protein [Phycisphaerae bacterium]